MKLLPTLTLFATLLSTPGLAAGQTCFVRTFAEDGTFLAEVVPGDGQPLACAAAQHTADVLNARHNNHDNGLPAVKAVVFTNN